MGWECPPGLCYLSADILFMTWAHFQQLIWSWGAGAGTKGMMMIWSVDQMNRAGIDWKPIQRDISGTGWIRAE